MVSSLYSASLLWSLAAAVPPTCDPSRRDETCIGVHGVPSWASDSSNSEYVNFIKKYDGDRRGTCGGTGSTVGQIDSWGACTGSSNTHVASTEALNLGSSDFSSMTAASQKLVATHKVWGSSASYTTGGVVKENIETGQDTVRVAATGETLENQNVLHLNFRGDAYDGPVRGLTRKGSTEKQCDSGAACPIWDYGSDGKRTGAVAATRENYGPGRYHVRAMIPKTSDAALGGRGYVFAIWTFHYEEIYRDDTHPLSEQYVSSDDAQNFESGSPNDGYYTGHNHEIDIEIPANSPQLDWDTQLGWDTMNANTWIGDNAKYCDGCDVFYQQAQTNAPQGTHYVSENGEYHDYDFEWYTDNNDPSQNRVAWFFDGQKIFETDKFVPTRAGHLLVGPWPAWWGSNGQSSTFETATVKIAELSITPQSGQAPLSFAQTYDQKYGSCDLSCDFQELPTGDPTPTPTPTPTPAPTPAPTPTPTPTPSPASECEGADVQCPNGEQDCLDWQAEHGCPEYTTSTCKSNGYCRIQSRPPSPAVATTITV